MNEVSHYKYCPSCRGEFQYTVSRCVECDVALVLFEELPDEEANAFPPLRELVLLRDGDRAWILVLAERLRAAEVGYRLESMASLFKEGVLPEGAGATGEGLFVRPEQAQQAIEIAEAHRSEELEKLKAEGGGEGEAVADACPACGHLLQASAEECPDCGLPFLTD